MAPSIFASLVRRKHINEDTVEESALARVLTVFDLTALGVGATLGNCWLYCTYSHVIFNLKRYTVLISVKCFKK